MSNTTNPEAWAAQERLRFIERSLWWRAQVKRKDLRELFGISMAQASSDLQRYLELNPTAARYDLKGKTYRGESGMTPILHEPRLKDALALFLPGGVGEWRAGLSRQVGAGEGRPGDVVAGVNLPVRNARPRIERAAFRALTEGLCLRIDYLSLSGRREHGWRVIVPTAFAHDGYRWHLRAWCEENGDYRDFVLSRIREADWPVDPGTADRPVDEAWETIEELVLIPNPALPPARAAAIAVDYGAEDGRIRLRVRRALLGYTLRHLGIADDGFNALPPLLVPVHRMQLEGVTGDVASRAPEED